LPVTQESLLPHSTRIHPPPAGSKHNFFEKQKKDKKDLIHQTEI
jgi:hypothetical protein